MLRKTLLVLALTLMAALAIAPAFAQQALRPAVQEPTTRRAFEFALIGDLGYTPTQDVLFKNVLDDLNATPSLAFVVHDGDMWGQEFGGCTDENYAARLVLFQSSVHPLVFTPGDNDWVDCWEARFGGYDNQERLGLVRRLFYPDQLTLGQRKLTVTRQSDDPAYAQYRENARWDHGEITFLTIHTTGSNNNLGISPEGDLEHAERSAANVAWLQQGFAHSRTRGSRAVMVITQANPGFDRPREARMAFNEVVDTLEAETLAYGKPVVFVHGDTHCYRVNKPLVGSVSGHRIENFTRVETFGTPDHTGCR